MHFAFEDGRTARVALPAGRSVVAVAPYVDRTHPCLTHSVSGCRGELANTPLKVSVRAEDGRIVFAGAVKTMDNGFVELWLPRGLKMTLTVEALGKRATGSIQTLSDKDTCVTTLQLL